MTPPTPETNRELLLGIRTDYSNHILEDATNFQALRDDNIEIKDSLTLLATKKDIEEMKIAFEDFTKAIGFLKMSGKIGYKILLISATIVVSIVALGGGFKTIIAWFIK